MEPVGSDSSLKCKVEGCDFCGKSEEELRLHAQSHNEQKTLKCRFEGCDYMTDSVVLMKMHSLEHLNQM